MEGRSQRVAGPLTRRHKQMMAAVGGLVAAGLAGVGIWSATSPGSYDRSRDGCITVNVPSSMGGSIMHDCGTRAQAICQAAFARHDTVSRLIQPQCRLAGLGPPPASAP